MLVVYEGGSGEVIVCEADKEPKVIREWFTEGKRDPDDYDRTEVTAGIIGVRHRPLAVDHD